MWTYMYQNTIGLTRLLQNARGLSMITLRKMHMQPQLLVIWPTLTGTQQRSSLLTPSLLTLYCEHYGASWTMRPEINQGLSAGLQLGQ